ncbi:MAG: hypothetical protein ACW98I_05045 [Candidatus Hodarchaeales archaeon]
MKTRNMVFTSMMILLALAFTVTTQLANGNLATQNGEIEHINAQAHAVMETSDGGYLVVGSLKFGGLFENDVRLVKTDSNGDEQWNQTFGGPRWDEAKSVIETADGGFLLAGRTDFSGVGDIDMWLVKTTRNGDEQWNQTFPRGPRDGAESVIETADGGFLLAGGTGYLSIELGDMWLIKTDRNGAEQWNRTFGGQAFDWAESVIETADGGFLLAGYTRSFGAGEADVWLVKTTSNGDEQWNQTFGGTGWDEAKSVIETADGGFLLAGHTYSSGAGEGDMWLVKTASNGKKQWNQTFDRFGKQDWGESVIETADGGYLLVGGTFFSNNGRDYSTMWLVKTDREGNELWDRTFIRDIDSNRQLEENSPDNVEFGIALLTILGIVGFGLQTKQKKEQ